MNFNHKTVLLNEAVEYLNVRENLIYVDGTLGGGGHSHEIAKKLGGKGSLFSFDIDKEAIAAASEKLKDFSNVKIIYSSYLNMPQVLEEHGIKEITGGILLDLGASYHQLTKAERGFSFTKEAPLDMRFNMSGDKTACEIVNEYGESELADIFFNYGEERFSRRIAKKIAEKRKIKKIETTVELATIIKSVVPFSKGSIHPATRVFQALRIAVNDELQTIEKTLQQTVHLLSKDARIVVISFHSLEDRLVKNIFKKYSVDCLCPPEQLICSCEPRKLKLLTKKPIIPSQDELNENPSARSAKMRAAVKL
jgi:16S rRNA (cytosine1402-N4)-methyltransferase